MKDLRYTDGGEYEEQPCPHCGRKPTPNGKQVWSAISAQVAYDVFNIVIFSSGLLAAYSLFTGVWDPLFVAYGVVFALAVMAIDVVAIVHDLVKRGFPFRHSVGDGPME